MAETINGRENLLAIYRHEKPARLPRGSDTAFMMFPGDWSSSTEPEYDFWGVRWIPIPLSGQMVDEKQPPIISDITVWREQVKIPEPEALCDWESVSRARSAHWNRETQMGALIMLEGHFERMHSLMGFENALCAFYDDEDGVEGAIRDLFSEITKYKFKCLALAKKYFDPDIIVFHDDWGTDRSMFFNPQVWHDFIKPELKKVIDECHRLGMKFEMHSCGHIQEVIPALVDELGIDSIQTLQYPQNDIRAIKAEVGDRLVIRGGYDGQVILRKDVDAEVKRETIRDSLSVLVPGGNHIPYYYSFGEAPEEAMKIFEEEVDRYEALYGCC